MTQPAVKCHGESVSIDTLKPNPRNPNKHPQEQILRMRDILIAQGWRSPIVVSNRSGFIVRGHGRFLASKQGGFAEVPVEFQDYETDEEELADLVADNALAEMSSMDEEVLRDIVREIDLSELDSSLTGMSADELDRLTSEAEAQVKEKDKPKPDVEKPLLDKLTEEHDYVVILCDNATDFTWLCAKFKIGERKSYKTHHTGIGRVVHVDAVRDAIA